MRTTDRGLSGFQPNPRTFLSTPVAVFLILALSFFPPVTATVLTVGPHDANFPSIQDAISYAAAGDTIFVRSGIYNETIRIDKRLILQGTDSGGGLPVIEPDRQGDAVEISAHGCTFSGFLIRNAKMLSGIRISSDNNTVSGNTIVGCSQGIHLGKADNNVISSNNITQSIRSGIALESSVSNRIEGNSLSANSIGITLDEYSSGNRIELNSFDNTVNVVSASITSHWDSGISFQYRYLGVSRNSRMGNHWNDYSGTDGNLDGIGDTSYVIQIGANKKAILPVNQNTQDAYPLMDPPEYYHDLVTNPSFPVTTDASTSPQSPGTTTSPIPTLTTGLTLSSPGGSQGSPFIDTEALFVPVLVIMIVAGVAVVTYRKLRVQDTGQNPAGGEIAKEGVAPSANPVVAPSGQTTAGSTVTDTPDKEQVPATPAVVQSYFPPALEAKYSDIRIVGRGGIAWVYSALRARDGKKVAVKIPISYDEMTGKSFLNEIKAWEMLRHPNIVEIYGVNILPVPYVEMEFVPGTLEEVVKPIPVWKAVHIVQGIADALRYAHSLGIIHRDIKPHNILVTADLIPKITDWGMSKSLVSDAKRSSIAGFSLSYAAPEQVSPSEFGGTDVRTDIYQLGVLFYELVTGSIPFGGESIVAVGNAILREVPTTPSDYNPEAAVLNKIILKCLEKDPAKRYQTAGELLNALSGYLDEDEP